jgi:hypothetical protein
MNQTDGNAPDVSPRAARPHSYCAGPGAHRPEIEKLFTYRRTALGVLAGLISLTAVAAAIVKYAQEGLGAVKFEHVLVASTAVLVWAWVWSTQRELELLNKWLDARDYTVPDGFVQASLIVAFGVFLAVLILTSPRIVWYASIFALYAATNLVALSYTNIEIASTLSRCRHRLDQARQSTATEDAAEISRLMACAEALAILFRYYMPDCADIVQYRDTRLLKMVFNWRNWQVAKTHLTLHGTMAALIVAVVARSPEGQAVAYLLMSLTVLLSEAWIAYYRIRRDAQLRPVDHRYRNAVDDRR